MGSADAVTQYEAASASGDIDALMKTLAPDAELISPIVANAVIRGHNDIRVVMKAVYTTVHDLKWREGFGDDHRVLMIGEAKVGPFRIGDAAIIELADDGSIRRIRPHLRPWLATTLFTLRVLLKVSRHPGVVRRSWRPEQSRLHADS
jgi:SnoaL-like domain